MESLVGMQRGGRTARRGAGRGGGAWRSRGGRVGVAWGVERVAGRGAGLRAVATRPDRRRGHRTTDQMQL